MSKLMLPVTVCKKETWLKVGMYSGRFSSPRDCALAFRNESFENGTVLRWLNSGLARLEANRLGHYRFSILASGYEGCIFQVQRAEATMDTYWIIRVA